MTTKTIITPFEYQCAILQGMDEWYNTPDYPALQEYFQKHDLWLPLAYAFNLEIITLDGATEKLYKGVEEVFSELLDIFGIKEGKGFRSFDEFHLELESKLK